MERPGITLWWRTLVGLCLVLSLLVVSGCSETSDDQEENYSQTAVQRWEDAISPTIVYINRDAEGSGALFDYFVPDPEFHVRETARHVCTFLYREFAEVPYIAKITLIVEYFDGVAWKAGNPPEITVCISSHYLQTYYDSGKDLLWEISGILYHELTHGYQFDDGGRYSELSGLIEGIADTVRLFAGYIDPASQHHGGHWTSGYKTTAFFFAWIEQTKHQGFLYELNQSLDPDDGIDWTWDEIETITGESVSTLWEEYQASF